MTHHGHSPDFHSQNIVQSYVNHDVELYLHLGISDSHVLLADSCKGAQDSFVNCSRDAEQGYADARSVLGFMYKNGKKVTKDYSIYVFEQEAVEETSKELRKMGCETERADKHLVAVDISPQISYEDVLTVRWNTRQHVWDLKRIKKRNKAYIMLDNIRSLKACWHLFANDEARTVQAS